ncbi:MAG: DUF2079 domain-containing protein [Planctomycetota bacterium]|nr:DUF2079 domain-containing protein [Planctomycetota bacterium]
MKSRQNQILWLCVWVLYAVMAGVTCRAAWVQYQSLETGWSWDLAYYNQWFWALCFGDETISVRPIASYATEGPSVWKMNYLSPLRFMILPLYKLRPDPTTLLYLDIIVFWLLIPASAKLVNNESESLSATVSALLLVPLTPLLRPLAINDFREMQMALPFAILAVNGWRERHRGWAITGILGLLCCRQEWAFVVATLAIIPARKPESIDKTQIWRSAVVMTGLIWFCGGFMIYLRQTAGKMAPQHFMDQFGGGRPTLVETLKTTWDFLWIGLSAWAVLALMAPRIALTALPWVWTLASGKWAIRFVGTEQWHHARYCVPFVALGLAAGLVGWSRLWNKLEIRFGHRLRTLCMSLLWLVMFIFLVAGQWNMTTLMKGIPSRVPDQDVIPLWAEIAKVKPDDGVIAAYELTAPLSSRRFLYSYVMDVNKPKGWPHQIPETIQNLFLNKNLQPTEVWTGQGFERVWSGTGYDVWRRVSKPL